MSQDASLQICVFPNASPKSAAKLVKPRPASSKLSIRTDLVLIRVEAQQTRRLRHRADDGGRARAGAHAHRPGTRGTYAGAIADRRQAAEGADARPVRSEEHTSELQSLMRISYAVFCLQNKTPQLIHD